VPEQSHLPLRVVQHEGSQFGVNLPVSRVLFDNEKEFITNYGQSSFTFAHLHAHAMLIESVTVKSKRHQTQ
jgi:hypothetical protein